MKKVELHVHLDGSLRVTTVADILQISVDEALAGMVVKDDNRDLAEYLTKFDLPLKAMQTKMNLKRVAYELASDLQSDGVIYAEVRFAPIFHTREGLSFDEIIESLKEGFSLVSGIKINLLLCMMRGLKEEDNMLVIKTASKYLGDGVCGIDLAGDEAHFKTSDYESLFLVANNRHIPYTIHAGEADGASSVDAAISFGAKRIGHGIRVLEDQDVLKKIIDKGILLEVCPTSNVQTRATSTLRNHPIRELYLKGVLVSVNTDNRTVSNINLEKEYANLKENLNFNDEDLLKMNINAIRGAFLSKSEKEEYITLLNENDKNITIC